MSDKSEVQKVVVKRKLSGRDKRDAKQMADGMAEHYGRKQALELIKAWCSAAGMKP